MTVSVYSIFDVKGKSFANPYFMLHDGQALRAFSDVVEDKSTVIARHPSDYKLYKIGTYDPTSGVLVGLPVPEFLANASDFAKVEVKDALSDK